MAEDTLTEEQERKIQTAIDNGTASEKAVRAWNDYQWHKKNGSALGASVQILKNLLAEGAFDLPANHSPPS